MLVGGHYPDAVASTATEHVHRFPSLLGSATFKTMYDKLLPAVKAWDGKFDHRYSSPEGLRLRHDAQMLVVVGEAVNVREFISGKELRDFARFAEKI
jgi:hypothetical protein